MSAVPHALVTGGAVRVGRAIVLTLLDAGYSVWVHCHRSARQARQLAEANPGRIAGVLQADLANAEARARLAAQLAEHPLDLLVNSAASYEKGAFTDRSDADLRRVLELNLVAPLSLTRALAPALGPEGAVVNIVDLGARHPWVGYLDHCVAKAALQHATVALAAELAPLRVNAVAPGTVAWPQDDRAPPDSEARARLLAKIPRGRLGSPEDVADAVCFLARSPHISGHTLVVDGGSTAALGGRHA